MSKTMEPMKMVRQTGTTIIFEEFNKQKTDLYTLLTRDETPVSLEKFKNYLVGAESEIAVRSFGEFVEKFAPTIYETVVKTGENTSQFVYHFEKPEGDCVEIQLKDHAFYKMILSMMDRKGSSAKGNLEFSYDDLKKALTPQAEMEECRRIRKNLQSNTDTYLKLVEEGGPSSEIERFAENIGAYRDRIIGKYKNKSPLALLPLLIADKQRQLDTMNEAIDRSSENNVSGLPPVACQYTFDNTGNLLLIEQSVSDDSETAVSSESTVLAEALRGDFQDYAPDTIKENQYIENMVISAFVPTGSAQLSVQSREELELQKKQYQDVYKDSLANFAKAVSEAVEKFIGVKAFFGHAALDGKLADDVCLIIANCKIGSILNNEQAKKRFKDYFTSLSYEKDINRIWFGIIPAVLNGDNPVSSVKKTVTDPFGRRTYNKETKRKADSGLTTLDETKEMLKLLAEAKIMTFISYKGSEHTGFIELSTEKVKKYKEDFASVESEYAVFCYPNFTILPKERNDVVIGTEYDFNEEKSKDVRIQIPGIYLDASYVAAGITVGTQNHRLLQAKGFKINSQYPCVRFDIELDDNFKMLTTTLNRETTTEMDKNIKNTILEEHFGFVFADNKLVYNGSVINNAYVMIARTLCSDKGTYKNIYKTLVRNLVSQMLYCLSDNITGKIVGQFVDDYVEIWKNDNKDIDKNYANKILLKGESIELDKASRKILVRFNKEEEFWNDIKIDDNESEE